MTLVRDFLDEYTRYRVIAEKAMAQVSDDGLNALVDPDVNSIAMLVHHVSGNLKSRFTDFLTSDGEKPWRDRDAEFEVGTWTRAEVMSMWNEGFAVLDRELTPLTDADLGKSVTIRGQALTVHQALCRSTAHVATHAGQIVLLARLLAEGPWISMSIPKGGSTAYNANPTREKLPG